MDRATALKDLRACLKTIGVDAMIIPSNDCHFGEYVQNYFCVRAWLSGFDGSAGTLVVTADKALLWTDSRYFIQAADQLKGSEIELMKMRMEGTPTVEEWLNTHFLGDSSFRVAIDGSIFSIEEYNTLSSKLSGSVVVIDDPFNKIWKEREPIHFGHIDLLDERYSGESVISKRQRIAEALQMEDESTVYILSKCDDIMYLCNLRGCDVDYNPVALSYAVVRKDFIIIFGNETSFSAQAHEYLAYQSVAILPYNTFFSYLEQLPPDVRKIVKYDSTSVKVRESAGNINLVEDSTPGGTVSYLKSIKNDTETEGFKEAFLMDGIAWCKLLKYIDDNIETGTLNEYNVALQLIEYRKQCIDYRGESFEPIVAMNANAASAHYSVSNAQDASKIIPEGFLLMDTGAHYLFGTTDTTRTISLSPLSQVQIDDYTLVLKGMIQLSMAVFPKGTRGSQLDILARGPIMNKGKMYFHGTGHGIGHYLCVHEGPQSIRMEYNPVTLEPGMIQSNEPAVYVEGKYGIRTENVILVTSYRKNDVNTFYNFETLTLVPIDTKCINKNLLGESCIEWLNDYHRQVFDSLSPYLSDEENVWLSQKTAAI